MPKFLFANNATSILRTDTLSGSTAITLPTGEGAKFPAPNAAAGEVMMLTLEDRRSGQMEIVRCTARATDVVTVTRAQEGTTAQLFVAGATISNRMTAGTFASVQAGTNFFYLGSWPSPPTAGATGSAGQVVPNPIPAGTFYFDTVLNQSRVWDGTGWVDNANALPIDGHVAMTGNLNMDNSLVLFSPPVAGNTVIDGGNGKAIDLWIDGGTF